MDNRAADINASWKTEKTAAPEPQSTQTIGVKKKKWIVCFDNAILDLDLSIHEKMVYIVLCSYASKEGTCYPSVKKIAADASCSRAKIFEVLNTLEKRGLIARSAQAFDGRQVANLYEILSIPVQSQDKKDEGELPLSSTPTQYTAETMKASKVVNAAKLAEIAEITKDPDPFDPQAQVFQVTAKNLVHEHETGVHHADGWSPQHGLEPAESTKWTGGVHHEDEERLQCGRGESTVHTGGVHDVNTIEQYHMNKTNINNTKYNSTKEQSPPTPPGGKAQPAVEQATPVTKTIATVPGQSAVSCINEFNTGKRDEQESKPAYPLEFEAFWAIYPKKIGKKASFVAWERSIKSIKSIKLTKLTKDADDRHKLILAAENYANLMQHNQTDIRYILNPENFLRQERWHDYVSGAFAVPVNAAERNPQTYEEAKAMLQARGISTGGSLINGTLRSGMKSENFIDAEFRHVGR